MTMNESRQVALIACERAGQLTLSKGRYRGLPDAPPIMGTVVRDLVRDGYMIQSDLLKGRPTVAKLTARGRDVAGRIIALRAEQELLTESVSKFRAMLRRQGQAAVADFEAGLRARAGRPS